MAALARRMLLTSFSVSTMSALWPLSAAQTTTYSAAPPERFSYLGNTSAMGAYTALLCVNMRTEVLDVAASMTYLELSADNSFMDEYMSALFLPHTDLDTFPTVRDMLAARGSQKRRTP